METNPASQENSDQVVIISYGTDDDDRLQQGSQMGQVRSYECHFCKRGFSNAQALGGHMNIHRKDKAKLKQSSSAPSLPNIVQPKNLPRIFSDQENMDHSTSTILRHDQSSSTGGRGFFSLSGQEEVATKEDNLDLELRLGHEPSQDDSPAAAGLRKFL